MKKRSVCCSLIVLAAAPLLATAQQPGPPGGWPQQQQPGPPGGWPQPQSGPPGAEQPTQSQSQSWADQQARNAAMQKAALAAQAQQPVRPQVAQYQRWQDEWRQTHPGEPMPTLAQFEKMHSAEIQADVRARGQKMWADRQAQLKADYLHARQMQEQRNAAQHVTWNSQQWAAFARDYDRQKHQEADDYLKAVAQAGEEFRAELLEQARREGRAF
jgi:hypothetical protein